MGDKHSAKMLAVSFEGEGVNFSMVFIGGVTLVGVYHSAM